MKLTKEQRETLVEVMPLLWVLAVQDKGTEEPVERMLAWIFTNSCHTCGGTGSFVGWLDEYVHKEVEGAPKLNVKKEANEEKWWVNKKDWSINPDYKK